MKRRTIFGMLIVLILFREEHVCSQEVRLGQSVESTALVQDVAKKQAKSYWPKVDTNFRFEIYTKKEGDGAAQEDRREVGELVAVYDYVVGSLNPIDRYEQIPMLLQRAKIEARGPEGFGNAEFERLLGPRGLGAAPLLGGGGLAGRVTSPLIVQEETETIQLLVVLLPSPKQELDPNLTVPGISSSGLIQQVPLPEDFVPQRNDRPKIMLLVGLDEEQLMQKYADADVFRDVYGDEPFGYSSEPTFVLETFEQWLDREYISLSSSQPFDAKSEAESILRTVRADYWVKKWTARLPAKDIQSEEFTWLETQLGESLRAQYQAGILRQRLEIESVQKRVDRLKSELDRREKAEDRVVQVRLGNVVLKAQGLLE